MLGKFGAGFRQQVQAAAAVAPVIDTVVEAPPAPVVPIDTSGSPSPTANAAPGPALPKAGPGRPRKAPVENVTNVAAPESKGIQMTLTFTGTPDELASLLEKIYA
jgi:hypothetical protein